MAISTDALFITSESAITGSYTHLKEEKVCPNRLLTQNEASKIGDINFSRAAAKANIYPTARLIMNEIRALIGHNGTFLKKINTLARDINVHRRTVQRWLKFLEKKDFIKITKRPGTTNLIQLKLFNELKDFINQEKPNTNSIQCIKASNDDEQLSYIFDGNEYSSTEITDYISTKVRKDGNSPGFEKYLWSCLKKGTLSLLDYKEVLSWGENNTPTRDEDSMRLVQKEQIVKDENKRIRDLKVDAITTKAKSDERGLDQLRSIANKHAKMRKQKDPLGLGNPSLELTIINGLIKKRNS